MNIRSSKRHCMVVHAYYPLGESRVEREAQALLANGYEVDVIALRESGAPAFAVEGGVNVYRLPVTRHKGLGLVVQLLEYLAFFILASVRVSSLHWKRRYGVVQVHNLPDFLVFAALLPKWNGCRIILDLHDLMPEFYAARFNGNMKSWPVRLLCWQESLSCGFADQVITVTEIWRQTLIRRGIPPEKIAVVMNVANDRVFYRSSDPRPARPAGGPFNLIYHGQICQRYGIDLAIRAVHLLRGQIPQILLTVHGRGDYVDELRALTEELGLVNHVRFSTDYVPTPELPGLIQGADAGVVPYRQDVFTDEILPTKLMEYAAMGIPAIAARTTAIAAYFDDSMVQFFRPEDHEDLARAILYLFNQPERLADLARNGDRFNQRYNWKKVSAQYVELVDTLNRASSRAAHDPGSADRAQSS